LNIKCALWANNALDGLRFLWEIYGVEVPKLVQEAVPLEKVLSGSPKSPSALDRIRLALGLAVLLACVQSLSAQSPQSDPAGPVHAKQERPLKTGPEIGQKIPFFQAPDQNGKLQDFDSVRGPKGAMVVFFRSADW
jgi:hypothetical protein